MKIIRSIWRFLLLLLHVLLGAMLTLVYSALFRLSFRKPLYRNMVRWWLGRVLRILGGRVRVTGTPLTEHALMVSNHVSWLDIPLLGGQSPVRFLSKSEVQHWPLVGWLANKAGTLYIERGHSGAAQQAGDGIARSLQQGDVVVLFPEGTTSDGKQLRPFHARLFSSAIEAGVPIQPVAIRYFDASGAISERVPYINEMSLWDNLTGILPQPYIDIEIHYLDPLDITDQSRRELAEDSRLQIGKVLSS